MSLLALVRNLVHNSLYIIGFGQISALVERRSVLGLCLSTGTHFLKMSPKVIFDAESESDVHFYAMRDYDFLTLTSKIFFRKIIKWT